ncbi:MAG: cytochrome c biogenesis protein CcsA [Rhodothermales bacterium]|nr:cytochrome c biogenesis protein CcsA [Rhodothermales bacterium]MBO6780304.1 cytochrome c biogenesis protein CcsA [Rhodothermales bacterium]
MIGVVGKLLILLGFVATGLAGLAYFRSAQIERGGQDWLRIGRAAWSVMGVGLIVAYGILFYLSLTHQFEYAYVYEHTARDLGLKYLISANWAGQEGSFMMWIFMNILVGWSVMKWAREYEAPVMAVISFCQFFLVSMVIGLDLGFIKLGASPFQLLSEKFPNAPMLAAGLVPEDGQGLNDLLQNYWMVIHPPTLFSGFAAMIVPFAFAVAALWKRRYTQWVRPALPWALFATMILGVGIAMGGYWAYETLSFGGYWAWDPVENSSLVPWLIGVAAIHTMIVQKRSGRSQKAALFLNILAYMLVIYSTFLTRSGILGDISVHSFVDLGLYNQLLLWILAMGAVGFGLLAVRYRELPTPAQEPEMLSREFMIFAGALLLCAIALVVILGTSAPIIGRLFRDNPSSVPIAFYNKWTLPLSVALTFLAGLGQLFWWKKMSVESVNKVLTRPIALSVASTLLVLLLTPFVEESAVTSVLASVGVPEGALTAGLGTFWATYGQGLMLLLLLFVSFFALYGNLEVVLRIWKGNPKLAGGAVSHVGFSLMILGIIASSGFSDAVGSGNGVRIGDSRDNFVLEAGQTVAIDGYTVTYNGKDMSNAARPEYLLDFVDPDGRSFSVSPVVYRSNKDQWIQHPDVTRFLEKDIFVAVSPNVMLGVDDSDNGGTITLARNDSTLVGDGAYAIAFLEYDLEVEHEAANPNTGEVAVGALLAVTNTATGERRLLTPVYRIDEERRVQVVPETIDDWGLALGFAAMNVDSGTIDIVVEGVRTAPADWVVVQAYEKPLISLVWLGIILLSIGFIVAIVRRAQDQAHAYRRAEAA